MTPRDDCRYLMFKTCFVPNVLICVLSSISVRNKCGIAKDLIKNSSSTISLQCNVGDSLNTSWTVRIAKTEGWRQDMHTGNTSFVKDPLHQQRKGAYSDRICQHMCNSCEDKKTRTHICGVLHHVCLPFYFTFYLYIFIWNTLYKQNECQFIHMHQRSVPAKVYTIIWDDTTKSYGTFCVCCFSWHGHNHGA